MAGQVRTAGGRLAVCVLQVGIFLTIWGLLVPLVDAGMAGCPTVRLFGSTSLYPHLFSGTYSMTSPVTSGNRPEYRNDESKSQVFFNDGYWHIENANRIRVLDSSFYLEDITGTFEFWDNGRYVQDPVAHFSCADITYICRNDKETIRCPRPDFQKLLIVRAIYGQDWACKLSMCTEREGDCTSCNWVSRNGVLTRVKARCSGSWGNCTLQPSDEMFGGDPCDHIPEDVDKYLKVEHRCINVPMSLGCYQDDPDNNRLLSSPAISHPNMTIQKCLSYCRSQSYRYGGVVNRLGCCCGNQLQDSASRRLPITDCSAPCGGDQFQFCGGQGDSQKMEVFEASIGACGGDLKTNEGTIYSPDFPGPYPLDQNCVWNLQVGSENVIRISSQLLDIADDSLTITEYRSLRTVVTVLNSTSMTEYVSVSSNISLQFRTGRQTAQQTEGFILRYEAVGHCGPIAVVDDVTSVSPDHGGNFAVGQEASITCKNGRNVTVQCKKNRSFSITAPYCTAVGVGHCGPVDVIDDVISVSPNHGGNFAIGQQATITCKNGQNVTVQCQMDGTFNIPKPYCSTDHAKWMAIVGGIVAVLVLLAIVLVGTLYIIRKRRAEQKQHTTSPGTAAYSAAPTSDSLVLTPGSLSARALGGENEAEDVHEYASIRDTGSRGTEPLYAQPDSGTKKPIELMYAKPMKRKKDSPSGKEEEEEIVDNILYESSVGEERRAQTMNGEQQGLIDNDLYGLQ